MSDVRERIGEVIQSLVVIEDGDTIAGCWDAADAILARWDLTEKPVVTDTELGVMVDKCGHGFGSEVCVTGERLRIQLERAGLTIVRSGEAVR